MSGPYAAQPDDGPYESCDGCGHTFRQSELRDYAGEYLCPDCYEDMEDAWEEAEEE